MDLSPSFHKPDRFGRFYQYVWIPLFFFISCMVTIHFTGLNRILFLWINHWSSFTGESLWAGLTLLGDSLVAAVLLLPWIRRKPDVIWAVFWASLIVILITHTLKPWLGVARPPAVLDRDLFTIIGPAHKARSFPSGHSATVFTIAGVFFFSIRSLRSRISLFLFALLVSLSRICVGVHWPLDILAGAFAGWLGAWLGMEIWSRFHRKGKPVGRMILGALLLISAVYLIFYDTGYPMVDWLKKGIATICFLWGVIEYALFLKQSLPISNHLFQRKRA